MGLLDILKWLREKGTSFDHTDLMLVTPFTARTVVNDALHHFDFKDGKVSVYKGYLSVAELDELVVRGFNPNRKFFVLIDERHILEEQK